MCGWGEHTNNLGQILLFGSDNNNKTLCRCVRQIKVLGLVCDLIQFILCGTREGQIARITAVSIHSV